MAPMTFPGMKLATFRTLNLDTLATWVWEAGWDYVQGALYEKDGERARLVMFDDHYSMVAL
jgi:hypothetical protein